MTMVSKLGVAEWTAIVLATVLTLLPLVPYAT